MLIVNSDPRKWPDWEELSHGAEKSIAQQAFCEGEYNDYLNKEDCTPEEFEERLNFLAHIWS